MRTSNPNTTDPSTLNPPHHLVEIFVIGERSMDVASCQESSQFAGLCPPPPPDATHDVGSAAQGLLAARSQRRSSQVGLGEGRPGRARVPQGGSSLA